MKKALLVASLLLSSVFFVAAQGSIGNPNPPTSVSTSPTGINAGPLLSLLNLAQTLVARTVPLLVGLAVLAFFWFLIRFIWKGQDSPDEQQKSMKGMGMSILAIFVMVSLWGIITFIGSVFGVRQGGTMSEFKLPGEQ